jgi:N-acylneuraminate cytidylyltransferase|tara:strand:+ start:10751 stop:11440 length:690 start_codon:yes stop_codon:yes gene_type:complete
MNIAIIPARGGSKRIPKKNIKNFLGKPIISYSVELAIKSNLFNKVIVSTDCDEIAEIAKSYGAEVPFKRPKAISDDFSTLNEVLKHAIDFIENDGFLYDYVCCIYATAPLIEIDDIRRGLELIDTKKWESVIAATNFSYPIFRSFEKDKKGGLKMVFPDHYSSRSQDLPEIFHDAGQFFWAKSEFLKKSPSGFNHNNTIIEIPNYRAQDIDTDEDWQRAELIYKYLNEL